MSKHGQSRSLTDSGSADWQVSQAAGSTRAAPQTSQADGVSDGSAPWVPSTDVTPALRNRVDQALIPKYGQRATRGRARHLIGFGDLCFGDPAAGGQLARADLVADDLRDLEVGRHGAGGVDLGHVMIVMARDQLLRA